MNGLQDMIHRLEEGGGLKWVRVTLAVLALLLMAVGYNLRGFKNMNSPEAMDSAQLARNIAEGRGYTTWFIRPFSIYLVSKRNQEKQGTPQPGTSSDMGRIKGSHPDIANPPVYPMFLAGLMKVLPFRYEIPSKPQPFWSYSGRFWRHQPDFLISMANQCLLVGVAAMAFLIGKKLFDLRAAWLSGLLVLGTEMLWRFSVSGLSTMLLLLLFMVLAYGLILIEEQGREPTWPVYKLALLAAGLGLLVGVGALTRYSFAWVLIPVLLFVGFFTGQRRVMLLPIVTVVFLIVFTPWIARNFQVSGTPFGTAGYALLESTGYFPDDTLQRSLSPELSASLLSVFWSKLITGFRQTITTDLPKLGGTWLTPFFLVGLLIGFRSLAARRLRYFTIITLVVLAVAQALGRTALSEAPNSLSTENLLVLFTPLVIIYGVSLFYSLLDQIEFPLHQLRLAAVGLFAGMACLPMLLAFLPPKTIPVAWPPYLPPAIQSIGKWMKPGELTMSDVPWAMAWYGRCPSVYYTLNTKSDFFAINDYMKPINALYLSPMTMDSRFLSQWAKGGAANWGMLVLETIARRQVPPSFPLRSTLDGWLPDHLVVTDWERWKKTGEGARPVQK